MGRESFLQRIGDILTDLKEQQEIICTFFFLLSLKYSFLSRAKNVKGKMILYSMYKQQLSFKLYSSPRDSNFYHLIFWFFLSYFSRGQFNLHKTSISLYFNQIYLGNK